MEVQSCRQALARLAWTVLAVLSPLCGLAQEGVDPGVGRVSLLVSDLERSLGFYEAVLGLEPDEVVRHETNSFVHELFGLNADDEVREVLMRSRDGEVNLGIVEVRGAGLDIAVNRGRPVLWIEVRMFDDVIAKAADLGLTLYEERSSVNLNRQPVREQVVVDWDGNRIILNTLDYREVIVGECVEVGDLQDWKVFDDRQIYVEGTVSGARLLLTTARCRGALYSRMFEIPNREGRLCKDGRIAYLDAGLPRTCRVETFELVPDLEEAARRATERRSASQYQ